MNAKEPLDETPYGKQFAECWSLLQRYMADLDTSELSKMSKLDAAETLGVLKRQPALGASQVLSGAAALGPEQLAVAILKDRLEILTGHLGGDPQDCWGARFLSRWKKLGGPVSSFSYAQIQKLKLADQEAVAKMFKSSMGSSQLRNLILNNTPEDAANALLQQQRMNLMVMAAILT